MYNGSPKSSTLSSQGQKGAHTLAFMEFWRGKNKNFSKTFEGKNCVVMRLQSFIFHPSNPSPNYDPGKSHIMLHSYVGLYLDHIVLYADPYVCISFLSPCLPLPFLQPLRSVSKTSLDTMSALHTIRYEAWCECDQHLALATQHTFMGCRVVQSVGLNLSRQLKTVF